MQDAQMVEAILAGQEAGLAAAYDRYAASLYGYCHSLLTEPAGAAAAVQDTFIVADGGLGGLRDPARLRPWLYAVARNECHRRLRTRASSAPLGGVGETVGVSPDTPKAELNAQADAARGEPGEMTGGSVDAAAEAERAELRAQAGGALAGLSPGDREIIELSLRHALTGRDLADVLGVSPNQARALASRARSQFERSLGARRGLDATVLLGLLPVTSAAPPPVGLRDQLLNLVGDFSPVSASYRAEVINRAGPFGRSGFPRPLDPPRTPYRPKTPALAATAGVAAVVVIAGVLSASYGFTPPGPHPPGSVPPGPSAAPHATPSGRSGAAASTAPANAPASAAPRIVSIFPGAASVTSVIPTASSSPSASQSSTPAPTATSTPTSPPTPAPPPTPPPPTPTPTPTPTPPTPTPPTPTPTPPTPTPPPTPAPTATSTPTSTSTVASPSPSLVAAP
jgi:RNA polymerase sigma factor (sigma-70 family)